METLRFSKYSIVIYKGDFVDVTFVVFLPVQLDTFYFSFLTAMARTSNTVLTRSDENGHPCLILDFREKAV